MCPARHDSSAFIGVHRRFRCTDMPNDPDTTTDMRALMLAMGERARAASRGMASATTAAKNRALEAAAEALRDREKALLAANAQDVKGARAEGRDDAFI